MKIALFEPQIPENMGNILRTASCFNLEVNIIMPCGFVFNCKKLSRVAMDYLDKVNYKLFNNWEEFKIYNIKHRIVLSTTKTDKSLFDFSFNNKDVLLFGNENSGVPDFISKTVPNKVTIPMYNNTRSLNLSVSVGIVSSFAIWKANQFNN